MDLTSSTQLHNNTHKSKSKSKTKPKALSRPPARLERQIYGFLLFALVAQTVSLEYSNFMQNSARQSSDAFPLKSGGGSLVTFADARVVGRMARMWYIKKQIKKLNKKLKGTTITLPIVTRIPIYDHAYYPSSQITQISEPLENSIYYQPNVYQGQQQQIQHQYVVPGQAAPSLANAGQQSGSSSSNNNNVEQAPAPGTSNTSPSSSSVPAASASSNTQAQQQQPQQQVAGSQPALQPASQPADLSMAVSASQPQYQYAPSAPVHNYQTPGMMMQASMQAPMMAYRRPPMHQQHMYHQQHQPQFARVNNMNRYQSGPSYRHPQQHQYINAYQPSPPTQVDHADGLYGHYGNAYGRYDAGYHMVF